MTEGLASAPSAADATHGRYASAGHGKHPPLGPAVDRELELLRLIERLVIDLSEARAEAARLRGDAP